MTEHESVVLALNHGELCLLNGEFCSFLMKKEMDVNGANLNKAVMK